MLVGPILACVAIVVVAGLLLREYHPHAVLLGAGFAMLLAASLLGLDVQPLDEATGFVLFDLFRHATESFSGTLAGVGLMIMAIGGFVATMDDMGASGALVRVATVPLGWLRRSPHLAAALVIPLGQALFICIPSAAGLGLLLMASVFPLLVKLGVSRLTAVAVIVASTSFGMGPASAMSAKSAELVELPLSTYFFTRQLPLAIPSILAMAVAFYVVNRVVDGRSGGSERAEPVEQASSETLDKAPGLYAVLPTLPVILLLLFSSLFALWDPPIILDTTTAIFISVLLALAIHALRVRDLKASFESLKTFWNGMGDIFKTVVTLIIAADVFARGLLSLGLVDALVTTAQSLGAGAVVMGIVMSSLIFLASILMGSGNASFFAFGPLVPRLAGTLGVSPDTMLLPMQFAASMGRSVSPIAGVVIATAGLADVSPLDVAKRTAVPLFITLVFMLGWHYVIG